jgi:hypothetical protein
LGRHLENSRFPSYESIVSYHTKSGFPTLFILQSAQADFVCIDAVSTAEFDRLGDI